MLRDEVLQVSNVLARDFRFAGGCLHCGEIREWWFERLSGLQAPTHNSAASCQSNGTYGHDCRARSARYWSDAAGKRVRVGILCFRWIEAPNFIDVLVKRDSEIGGYSGYVRNHLLGDAREWRIGNLAAFQCSQPFRALDEIHHNKLKRSTVALGFIFSSKLAGLQDLPPDDENCCGGGGGGNPPTQRVDPVSKASRPGVAPSCFHRGYVRKHHCDRHAYGNCRHDADKTDPVVHAHICPLGCFPDAKLAGAGA